jgi:hypothetical protein
MTHAKSQHSRQRPGAAYVLLTLGALTLHTQSSYAQAAQAPLSVIVIAETKRGWDDGVLSQHGLAAHSSSLNKGPMGAALRTALHDENPLARMVVPTACPSAATREACPNIQFIRDVDLDAAIDQAKTSTIVVLWPEAGYSEKEQLYMAYFDVDVLERGRLRTGSFYLGYREWHCGADCVAAAYEASAKELAAMVRFVLAMEPGSRTNAPPAAWQGKPLVKDVHQWANSCATDLRDNRVIREYGERFWLNEPGARSLLSAAWRGCNVFESGS